MFKKYPEIENAYQQKFINRFLERYPQLKNEIYIIQNKIDGSNIQFMFYPCAEMKVASRNRIIERDENFNDVWNVIARDEYKELFDHVRFYSNTYNKAVHLFGEIYGQGIQKRINYGPDKYISIFDFGVSEGDELRLFAPHFLYTDYILSKYTVDYTIIKGLDEALNYKPENWDEIEGVVIKPYYNLYFSAVGSIFYLKNKNPSFEEKSQNKKVRKEISSFREEVENARDEFGQYLNENRVLSTFSKMGEIQDNKQIGEYIKAVLEDAKKDFFNDGNTVDDFTDKEVRHIFNKSKQIVPILQKYL